MTIVEFLEARLDEDEGSATWSGTAFEGRTSDWTEYTSGVLDTGDDLVAIGDSSITRHFETHDPARVLRDVAAKRAILAQEEAARSQFEHVKSSTTYPAIEVLIGQVAALATVIRHLASAYSDHPDYQAEWAIP